jgi:hypothetical protein
MRWINFSSLHADIKKNRHVKNDETGKNPVSTGVQMKGLPETIRYPFIRT